MKRCGETAAADGWEYAWVDTCCINKKSSAELSGAINSMYQWYQRAEVCYAFISDVPSDDNHHQADSAFRKNRWFTRGRTLQELLAPKHLTFLGSDWKDIGSKFSLRNLISNITKIHIEALEGQHLGVWSVAQRMSWASLRVTIREEDIAYSLMGIFGVNMPLLYVEGEKAFIRLQEEIIRETEDDSIFAWFASKSTETGLLASRPNDFYHSSNVRRFNPTGTNVSPLSFSLREQRIELQASLLTQHSFRGSGPVEGAYRLLKENGGFCVMLNRFMDESDKPSRIVSLVPRVLGLLLVGETRFQRAQPQRILAFPISDIHPLETRTISVIKAREYYPPHLSLSTLTTFDFRGAGLEKQLVFLLESYPTAGKGSFELRYQTLGIRYRCNSGIIFDVVLGGQLQKFPTALVAEPRVGESLADVCESFGVGGSRDERSTSTPQWLNDPLPHASDCIIWQHSSGQPVSVKKIKKIGRGWRPTPVTGEEGSVMERIALERGPFGDMRVSNAEGQAADLRYLVHVTIK
jgi:hypothetical protein